MNTFSVCNFSVFINFLFVAKCKYANSESESPKVGKPEKSENLKAVSILNSYLVDFFLAIIANEIAFFSTNQIKPFPLAHDSPVTFIGLCRQLNAQFCLINLWELLGDREGREGGRVVL